MAGAWLGTGVTKVVVTQTLHSSSVGVVESLVASVGLHLVISLCTAVDAL